VITRNPNDVGDDDATKAKDYCLKAAQMMRAAAADLGLDDPHGRWFQTLATILEQEARDLREEAAPRSARLRLVT
jgi:hypothetical protein